MLNQDRIKLMTHMAAYEESQGKRNMSVASYFRGDYIGLHVIESVICATIMYAIAFAAYIFYDFETFMQDIYKMDLLAYAKQVIVYYVVFVAIYAVISYIVSSCRYSKAKKGLKKYHYNLKQLSALYDLESRGRN